MKDRVQVVYTDPGIPGYNPVYSMARLAANLLDGDLVVLRSKPFTTLEKLAALVPRKRTGIPCLLICPAPSISPRYFWLRTGEKDMAEW